MYGQGWGEPQGPQIIGPLRKDMLQTQARHAKSTESEIQAVLLKQPLLYHIVQDQGIITEDEEAERF